LTLGGHAVSEAWADDVVEQVRTAVRRYHEEQPAEPGMTREELQRAVGIPAPLLAALLPRTGLGVEAEIVHDPGHRVDVDALLHLLADAGLSPPTIAELHLSQRLVAMLVRDDAVVVAGPYAFRRNDFDRACAIVRALIEDGGPQTAGALRDALHVTRKHAIPLLEAMDAAGVTRRSGDLRS
jgi:selenocysteine-specific elongation factor